MMNTKQNKRLPILISSSLFAFLTVSLIACGDTDKNDAPASSPSKSKGKSLLITKISDPLLGMGSSINTTATRKHLGHAGEIIEYKQCMEGQADYYEDMKEEMDENNKFNDMKAIEIVDVCPAGAAAKCDSSMTGVNYYYTNSKRVLDGFKDECSGVAGEWSQQQSVAKAKKATAIIIVNGTTHNFENNNNCIQVFGQGPISTPVFSNKAIQFGMSQGEKNWDFNFMIPNDDGRTVTLYKGVRGGSNTTFDGKKIKGSAKLANTNKSDDTVDVSFDINCL